MPSELGDRVQLLNFYVETAVVWMMINELKLNQDKTERSMMLFIMVVAGFIPMAATVEERAHRRHLNPQEFMNSSEIIQYWRYPSEEHEILTSDGYYLLANRIPYGMNSPGKIGLRPIVLLVPGLIADPRNWIANLPNNSLAFVLADAGYDVWILNNRGTTWSRRHQNLSIEQEEFWDFSFHEMAIYDIPAAIIFILQKTKQEELYFIGYSQGGSLGFISFLLLPHIAEKIKLFIALAPAYTFLGSVGPSYYALLLPEVLIQHIWGNKEFCVFSNKLKLFNAKLCSYPVIDKTYLMALSTTSGLRTNSVNVSRADVIAGIYPDYTSVKTIIHWSQVAKTKEFKYFDYGLRNKEVYNMNTPPFYKIEDITVPTAVWSGTKDKLAPPEDIDILLSRIPPLVFHKILPGWQHLDYMWSLDIPIHLLPDMLYMMQKYK